MKIYELVNDIDIKDTCFAGEIQLSCEERKKIFDMTMEKTGLQNKQKKTRRRKTVVLVAAVLVMMFGITAYASGLLKSGTFNYKGVETPAPAAEGSLQLKAMTEYENYCNSLDNDKYEKLKTAYNEALNSAEKGKPYQWVYFAPEKAEEIAKKYGLECISTVYTAKDVNEAFVNTDTADFLGNIEVSPKADTYLWSKEGVLKFDINSAEYYCGIDCIPDNVFEGSRTFGPWGDDLEIRSKESWNCALNKNISAECLMYMDIHGDTGRQAPSYRALIKAGNRTIMVSVIPKKNGKASDEALSKKWFEEFLGNFRFDILK